MTSTETKFRHCETLGIYGIFKTKCSLPCLTVLSLHYTHVVFLQWQSSWLAKPSFIFSSTTKIKNNNNKKKISFSVHKEEKQQFIVKTLRIGQTCNSLIEKDKEPQEHKLQVIPVYMGKYFREGMFANCKLKMTSLLNIRQI